MKAEVIGRKAIKLVNSLLNIVVLIIVILLTAFAGYALWDSNHLHKAADKSTYAIYKPSQEDEGKSFLALQAINPEVIAWLSVYGTNIDYPVTQGSSNMKYVNTSAEGLYSLSGSIFLDCRNSNDFSDFNSILYGHHMAKQVMFGEIGDFSDRKIFDSHRYGNLYFGGKDHGIEFFAFVHTDAYDSSVFTPNMQGAQREEYLYSLYAKTMHKRDVCVTAEDRIILLSTCSSRSTNGRDILVGRITDEVYDDLSPSAASSVGIRQTDAGVPHSNEKKIPVLKILLVIILVIVIIACCLLTYYKRRRKKEKKQRKV